MAQTIKFLDPQEAIKIAAGEVVERPAHIIKELIENSIDAQSNTIIIQTRAAGKDEIIITDDGSGMSPEDAKLCFAHHATSKISTVHDLETVTTYGFRGEALSSIASVSRVELTTKIDDQKSASHLILQDSKIIVDDFASHPTGTTISITNLFDNIPARKKFLKSDDTEWNLVVSIFQAFCLRKPNIHFKLFHNGHMSYNCPPTTDIKVRCAQLWSGNLSEQLLTIDPTIIKNISISGAISTPHYYRFNRGQIFIFINNRWVKNIEITKGLIKGYDGVLPAQKYPAAFLFIDIDPTQVDINVHPKKEEVKFLHPGIVQRAVEEIVKQTLSDSLNKNLSSKPVLAENNFSFSTNSILPQSENIIWDNPEIAQAKQPFAYQPPTQFHTSFQKLGATPFFHPVSFIEQAKQALSVSRPEKLLKNDFIYEQEPFSIVGQFKKTYIMIEKEQQLILVDQHAAHERILYERFKKNADIKATTVQLLFPHIVKLTTHDIQQLEAHLSLFEKHGILLEPFSQTEIIIQSTPVQMQAKSVEEIIHLSLDLIKECNLQADELFNKLHDKILSEKACKAACRAGDTLNHEQMSNILNELEKTENRFCCPHGRPTLWSMELKEIERHFKRDYVGSKQNQQIIF
ncbi:MAG: DNA mismatch repair endonuclease MutL [Candidatus Dependentiae bacterium]|nr:DNA mismatch repair endonuclease MutL [Candidatus Dependentiae bacterium]